ncbi:MAG: asparagine synthetase B, partial [Gemmatimonadota bacterium]|nr:asparagine synthetase B [Gemmatimonadota bacterium]
MLTAMRDSMAHRGPDDAGLLVRPHVGLGHRRLSIVDVSSGRQPMVTQDGRFALVYNGEIYNHLKLRKRLESRGARFETRCDTEAVLHLCAQTWADDIAHLNGMFAFAAWDEGEQALLLARDRFGIKPLYYVHKEDGTLFFASEIKAFVAAGVIQPSLNHSSLSDFLANHTTTGEETLFEGVRRLPAGHVLHWKGGTLRIEGYWDLPQRSPDPGTNDAMLLEGFEAALS